jgi:hypothetical protein
MVAGYVHDTRKLPRVEGADEFLPSSITLNGFTSVPNAYDMRMTQDTFSYRTNQYGVYPDFDSAQGILTYFLRRGLVGKYDRGHDFWTVKNYRTLSHEDAYVRSLSQPTTYGRGCLVPEALGNSFPVPVVLDKNFYGNKAISTVAPTVPVANLAQTSAEIIREHGIKLPGASLGPWLKSRASFYRSIGSEYLNVTFGWAPFLNDLYKILRSMSNINQQILQYSRDSERVVRRRYDFQPITTTTSVVSSGARVNFGANSNISGAAWNALYVGGIRTGALTTTEHASQHIWWKGGFSYYLNPGTTVLGKIEAFEQLINKFLGTRITPSVLWELTPWSWFIDWFVDVQSALLTQSQLQSDGLVAVYSSLMRTTFMSKEVTVTGIPYQAGPTGPISGTLNTIRKERIMGTPFGFGLNPASITERQWAILAALAISKGPRTLPQLPKGPPTD